MLSVGLLRTKQNNRKLNCPIVLDNMFFEKKYYLKIMKMQEKF